MTTSSVQTGQILLAAATTSALIGLAICAVELYTRRSRQGSPTSWERIEQSDEREKRNPYDASPRTDYLSWDDYFMAVAFLSAQRSKDPNKQVGACIVGMDQIILGIGYNGFPRGCADGKLPWAKLSRAGNKLHTKYPYVVHAEANSILNAKNTPTLAGAKLYVTMFPCNECAKLIIQAGIKEVIFFEDKKKTAKGSPTKGGIRPEEAYLASRQLLSMAGLKLRQHRLQLPLTIGDPQRPPRSPRAAEE